MALPAMQADAPIVKFYDADTCPAWTPPSFSFRMSTSHPRERHWSITVSRNEGISFWWDRRLNAGDLWDSEIKTQLKSADVILALVSQAFLNSEYVRNVEIRAFLEARRTRGLTFAELTRRWGEMRTGIGASNKLLGGSTPMCECLRLVKERFVRERALAPADSKYILFIVSDGESSDGDPRTAARLIEDSGVQIVSCFVTSSDQTVSKRLYSDAAPSWNSGAKGMFDIASRAAEGSAELDYLRKAGWQIEEPEAEPESIISAEAPGTRYAGGGLLASLWRALGRQRARPAAVPAPPPAVTRKASVAPQVKMFAQVNHSEHLEEFIKVILTPIQLEHQA